MLMSCKSQFPWRLKVRSRPAVVPCPRRRSGNSLTVELQQEVGDFVDRLLKKLGNHRRRWGGPLGCSRGKSMWRMTLIRHWMTSRMTAPLPLENYRSGIGFQGWVTAWICAKHTKWQFTSPPPHGHRGNACTGFRSSSRVSGGSVRSIPHSLPG